MCPAILPTALEATKVGCPNRKFCFICMPSLSADGVLAGSGPKLPAELNANFSAAPATASHRPLTLQGCLNNLFGRLANCSGRGCAGWARAAGVNSAARRQT
eukprot:1147855-Pelagomonas_calceolata.AAC.2